MIKFQKFYVQDTETGKKVKVYYSLSNHRGGVTIYAKEYGHELGKILPNVTNDTDTMTDYFCKSQVTFQEGDEHYEAAKARAEKCEAEDKAQHEARQQRHREKYEAYRRLTMRAV